MCVCVCVCVYAVWCVLCVDDVEVKCERMCVYVCVCVCMNDD